MVRYPWPHATPPPRARSWPGPGTIYTRGSRRWHPTLAAAAAVGQLWAMMPHCLGARRSLLHAMGLHGWAPACVLKGEQASWAKNRLAGPRSKPTGPRLRLAGPRPGYCRRPTVEQALWRCRAGPLVAPWGEQPAGGCCYQFTSQPAFWCPQLQCSSPGSETPVPSCCGRPHEYIACGNTLPGVLVKARKQ